MVNKSMSSGLDYNIDSLEGRKQKVEQIIKQSDTEVTAYFDDYYNPSLTQNSRLSENDPMCKQLERLADYLLYADNKEKRKNNHGDDLHIVNSTDEDKNKKKEVLSDNMFLAGEESKKVNQHKLYRKVKVTNEDREQFPELKETGELIKNLKHMIDTGVDSQGNHIGEDAMKKLKWYLIDIRKDEVAMKEILKGYIRFKRLSPEGGDNDFSGFSFDSTEHVGLLLNHYSELKQSSFDDTHGDLKLILEVFEDIVDSIEFEKYMFDIFIMKIDGVSGKNIIINIEDKYGIKFSEQRISQITKNVIPEMIAEAYKSNYEDWVYTFVLKGTYKTCNKCGESKLLNKFGVEKRSKDGRRNICNDCRKSK